MILHILYSYSSYLETFQRGLALFYSGLGSVCEKPVSEEVNSSSSVK